MKPNNDEYVKKVLDSCKNRDQIEIWCEWMIRVKVLTAYQIALLARIKKGGM